MSGQQHAPAHFTLGKHPVPILQEAGWAPGPVWIGEKSRPHQNSILDHPAHSKSLYWLSYPAHSNQAGWKEFPLPQNVQTNSGAQTASYGMGTGGPFEGVQWPRHGVHHSAHLAIRLFMSTAIPLPPYLHGVDRTNALSFYQYVLRQTEICEYKKSVTAYRKLGVMNNTSTTINWLLSVVGKKQDTQTQTTTSKYSGPKNNRQHIPPFIDKLDEGKTCMFL